MRTKPICGIYKITSPNGKIYIGKSKDIQKRKRYYKTLNCKEQRKIYWSLLKYGWDKHDFHVIHTCENEEQLNELEIYYIKKYNSFESKTGLNLHQGGENGKYSKETASKKSKSLKGRISPNKGIAMSEEQKRKISESNKGRTVSPEVRKKISNALMGRKISKETRLKRSLAFKGRVVSEETKEKLRIANRGKTQNNPKHKLNLKIANEIRRLYSVGNTTHIELSIKFNISRSVVSNLLRNYIWKNGI